MEFQQQKKLQLSRTDKSSIREWDSKIKPLCNKINKHSHYYTTSSCGGRVVLLKSSDKKIKNAFLFRTHNKLKTNELKQALLDIDYKGLVEFQQTSCILHVASISKEKALNLVQKAKSAGWKRSGLMPGKRNIVELHSTESISFPIMKNKIILVDDVFLKLITKQANNKLERTWKKINKLKKSI